MKNFCFDICAIPIYLIVLWTCYSRKMTQGRANRIFIATNYIFLVCAALDILMEFVVNPLPLSQGAVALGTAISFTYKFLRNGTLVVFLIFVFEVTRTAYHLRRLDVRIVLWLPNAVLIITLLQNFFTHNVFIVTQAGGYTRGPLLSVCYCIAVLYGIVGMSYCVYCKRYLATSKWIALLSVYVLQFTGVFIQLALPNLMVELFASAIGVMLIMLVVMRPEDMMDSAVGIQNYATYQNDLKNIIISKESAQVVVIQMINATEIRSYLGEDRYNAYVRDVADEIVGMYKGKHVSVQMYFERPGAIYLILDDTTIDVRSFVPMFLDGTRMRVKRFSEMGARFEPRICLIRYPDDLEDLGDILNLGHKFTQLSRPDDMFVRASEIVKSRDFQIVNNMDDILARAVTQREIEMYYQPIYDVKTGMFRSAEALARLNDSEYGMISPARFIPAAEANGLILPIGEMVLDNVYRFISQYNLKALGVQYIEINLSVAQVLQNDLPQTVSRLQEKYGIDPEQVNFEITETLFDNISDVMEKNVSELRHMGYSFSLDDYGVGYSNIHRLNKLPLDIIKIDKSLVDGLFTEDGDVIFKNTVRMMQGIHKELVVEGVETKEAIDAVSDLSCDFIQGFYYSRPLPEEDFVRFIRERNRIAS